MYYEFSFFYLSFFSVFVMQSKPEKQLLLLHMFSGSLSDTALELSQAQIIYARAVAVTTLDRNNGS